MLAGRVGCEVMFSVTVSSALLATYRRMALGSKTAWTGTTPVLTMPTLVSPETSRRLAAPGSATQGCGVPDGSHRFVIGSKVSKPFMLSETTKWNAPGFGGGCWIP